MYFGESDVHPRHPEGDRSRARGEGRERGNLLVTTSTPPVAQGAGGIYIYIYIFIFFVAYCIERSRICLSHDDVHTSTSPGHLGFSKVSNGP